MFFYSTDKRLSDFTHKVKQETNTRKIINNNLIQKVYFPWNRKKKEEFPLNSQGYWTAG